MWMAFLQEGFTMKNNVAMFLMVVGSFLSGQAAWADESIALVPRPLRMERKAGQFLLRHDTAILVDKDSADAARVGEQLAQRLRRSTAFALAVTPLADASATHNRVVLTATNANVSLGPEGYTLDVTADGVRITATAGPGLFYGTMSLLQLFPPQAFSRTKVEGVAWRVPAVHIEDRPRFSWRGLLLDVARHFFNKQEVENFIDLMAQHKLNTLQLHLTDDEGWRVEIQRYPRLTQIGAWRKNIGYGLDPKQGTAYGPDGRYGGFYTADDIHEMVAYAKARYVTIVPEIEMPGHAGATRATYPEFSCAGGAPATNVEATLDDYVRSAGCAGGAFASDGGNRRSHGAFQPTTFHGVYCAGNDAVFEFLQNVLAEILELFPGNRIHVGGDEVVKDGWKKCPQCQACIRREGLKDENGLQNYFMRRIKKFLDARNCITVGWDEVESRRGGVSPYAIVMSWRSIDAGIAAANAGLDVVMTPASYCYFDYYQAKTGEPKAIGGILTLRTAYDFEPVPQVLAADRVQRILGAGGALWSEFFPSYAHVQYMTYPRACALAEVTWSDPKSKRWEDFRNRLDVHLQRLKAQGVNYRQPHENDDAPGKAKPRTH
jgi:hexosaminidase